MKALIVRLSLYDITIGRSNKHLVQCSYQSIYRPLNHGLEAGNSALLERFVDLLQYMRIGTNLYKSVEFYL